MRQVLRSTVAFALAFGVSFVAASAVTYQVDRHAHPEWRTSASGMALFALAVGLPVVLCVAVASHAAVLAAFRRRVAAASGRAVVGRAVAIGLLVPLVATALSSLAAPRNELYGTVVVTTLLTLAAVMWPRGRRVLT